MTIIVYITVLLLIILALILIEYSKAPQFGLKYAAQKFKVNVSLIISGLLEPIKIRYIFEYSLQSDLIKIVDPYSAIGMDIEVNGSCENGLPYIYVKFVPSTKLSEVDIATLAEHLKIKLRHYLSSRNLSWSILSTYLQNKCEVFICLFYAEFKEDYPLLIQKYRQVIQEKCGEEYGYVKDDDLERELKNVNTSRV